jgi:hypothetical protein
MVGDSAHHPLKTDRTHKIEMWRQTVYQSKWSGERLSNWTSGRVREATLIG